MGGKYINKQQAKLYMKYRNVDQLTQVAAAAKTGVSERSGRTIEKNEHHSSKPKQPRQYKTRKSPVDEVWINELEPMLRAAPHLQAKTLFIHLQRTKVDEEGHPIYPGSVLRTVQRYVAKWQAINGKEKALMFPQEHIPGEQGLSDFTEFKGVTITLNGVPFPHRFYHFRLVYSKWSYLKVIQSGESMQALSEGLQEALQVLGGAPREHRTDSLSAAFKNLSKETISDLTLDYEDLCAHYGMTPSRNNKGEKHENGSVESSHGHVKNRIEQELILRGSYDFPDLQAYETFIQDIVKASNQRNTRDFETERMALQPLPVYKTTDYEVKSIPVTNLGLVRIKQLQYSVPSQLCGHTVTFHIYQHRIKAYLGATFLYEFIRRYQNPKQKPYVIDYKHMIASLLKKPNAFRRCKYRNELLPNDHYRTIWQHLEQTEAKDVAAKMMLRLLKLAAEYHCEVELAHQVLQCIDSKQSIHIPSLERLFNTRIPNMPALECTQHTLAEYDDLLLNNTTGENHDATL
jgi:hypothetical protein